MKRTSIRLICLLLCMLMVAPVLLSCKRDDPTPTPPAGDDSVTYTIESNIENNTVALVKKGDAAPTYELAPHITVTDNLPLTYTSSNEEVATVTEAGVVSAVAPGAATVTVANAEKNLSLAITVNVFTDALTVTADLDEQFINYYGRNFYDTSKQAAMFTWGASGFEVTFFGTEIKATMVAEINQTYKPRMQVLLDGEKVPITLSGTPKRDTDAKVIEINTEAATEYTIVSGLAEGWHTVKVLKRTAAWRGLTKMDVAGLVSLSTDGHIIFAPEEPTIKIDVYGDSISCAYGILDGENMNSDNTNAMLTYAYLAAEALGAQVNIQACSGWGAAWGNSSSNYEESSWADHYTKTTIANPTEWDFSKYQADVIVINLGTNDGGTKYDSAQFKAKYESLIEGLKAKNPNAKFVLLYGMMSTKANVKADIQAVADKYDYVEYLNASSSSTYAGNSHPDLKCNRKNAVTLTECIKTLLGIQ